MLRKAKQLSSQAIPVAADSLHPYRCSQCNRFFHEFWFSTRHKKKHEGQYRKFWHCKKRPYLRKRSRVDELCEKMMAQQQNILLHRSPQEKLSGDGSAGYSEDSIAGQVRVDLQAEKDLALTKKSYNTRSQTVSKTAGVSASSIRDHKNKGPQANPGEYPCETCRKVFKHKSHLRRHKKEHPQDETRIICQECSMTFQSKANHKIHLKTHSRVACAAQCGKEFSRLQNNDRPLRCHLCPKTFVRQGHLSSHEKTHAKEKMGKEFLCNLCGKGFNHLNSLKTHEYTHANAIYFKCEHCNRVFSKYDAFKVHESTHAEGRFKCQYCDKSFVLSGKLLRHQKIHSNIKGHQCKICCRGFRRRSSLKQHLELHTVNTEFTCETCCKAFIDLTSLKTHEKCHVKEMTNYCGMCKKAFSDQSQVKSQVTNKGNRLQECQVCSSRFCHEMCLKNHHSRFHQSEVLEMTDEDRAKSLDEDRAKSLDEEEKRPDATQSSSVEEVTNLPGNSHLESMSEDLAIKGKNSPKKDLADLNTAGQAEDEADNISEESLPVHLAEDKKGRDCVSSEPTDITGWSNVEDDVEDKQDDESVDNQNSLNLGIAKQPLVKSLGMSKIHSVAKRGRGRMKCHSQVRSKKSGTHAEDDIDNSQDESSLLNIPSQDNLYIESDHNTKRETIPTSGALTEDNIQDSKDPVINVDFDPLDLSKEAVTKEAPNQSSVEKSNECTNVPDTKSTKQKQSMKIQIPSFLGMGGCAIEEELLKFYGHAISHIGLTVYKEHENELYGRNLSQIGLYNSGRVSDVLSKDQKHL